MTDSSARPPLAGAARHLITALRQETALARQGALPDLAAAAAAKQEAFAAFRAACAGPAGEGNPSDREALREVIAAADENAVMLEAVQATLKDFAGRVRMALAAAMDPGVYGPASRRGVYGGPARRRHVLAASLDASF